MTVPVTIERTDDSFPPSSLAAPGRYLWSHEGRGFVAWGEWASVEVGSGPDRFERAVATLDVRFGELDQLEGVIALGSFTFDQESARSILVIPRTIVHAGPDGTTIVTIGSRPDAGVLDPPEAGPGDRIRYAGSSLPDHLWLDSVARAVKRIEAGELEKVVLARDVKFWGDEPFDTGRLARNLARSFPGCFTFSVRGLVGASPEMLIERRGSRVRSVVLAGTAARGSDEHSDAERGRALLSSDKDLREHVLAVDSVRHKLEPLSTDLRTGRPELLRLKNVQHLATEIEGTLHRPVTALELAGSLHPTAAVGGAPRETSMAIIRELEGMDRDRYAGPVGWVDPSGDGEWAIALRCGIFEGAAGRIFAGSGIVAGSEPLYELEETRLKLRAIQSALEGTEGAEGSIEAGDRQVADMSGQKEITR